MCVFVLWMLTGINKVQVVHGQNYRAAKTLNKIKQIQRTLAKVILPAANLNYIA